MDVCQTVNQSSFMSDATVVKEMLEIPKKEFRKFYAPEIV